MTDRPLFKQSAETVTICNLMRKMRVGDVLTYATMMREIRTPITREKLQSALTTAQRAMHRDCSMVFGTIRGEGVKLLDAVGVIEKSDQHALQMRRKARRATSELATVNTSDLKPEIQGKHSARLAVFAAVGGLFDPNRKPALPDNSGGKRIGQ